MDCADSRTRGIKHFISVRIVTKSARLLLLPPPANVVGQEARLPFVIRVSSFSNDGVISTVLPRERGFLFWLSYLFFIVNNKNTVAKNSV